MEDEKFQKIKEDLSKVIKDGDVLTGLEIKNLLWEVYASNKLPFYPEIKALKRFGYKLERFLDKNKFKYKITK